MKAIQSKAINGHSFKKHQFCGENIKSICVGKKDSDILLKPCVLNCDILWHLAVVIVLSTYVLNTDILRVCGQGKQVTLKTWTEQLKIEIRVFWDSVLMCGLPIEKIKDVQVLLCVLFC